jgi:hypothetical protein
MWNVKITKISTPQFVSFRSRVKGSRWVCFLGLALVTGDTMEIEKQNLHSAMKISGPENHCQPSRPSDITEDGTAACGPSRARTERRRLF